MGEEVSPEIILSTQKLLGRYVNKPPLTEKLLKKPPFRFLHDVIHTVIKETGFLKGLFTETELNSDNVKDRDAKVAYLNKLIGAVKSISGTDLKVRASKVIAGLEPQETNKLLQTIAKCIDKKLDSKQYVTQLKSNAKKEAKDAPPIADRSKKVASKTSTRSEKSLDSNRTKESSKSKSNNDAKTKVPRNKLEKTPSKSSPQESDVRKPKEKNIKKESPRSRNKKEDSPRAKSSPKPKPMDFSPTQDEKPEIEEIDEDLKEPIIDTINEPKPLEEPLNNNINNEEPIIPDPIISEPPKVPLERPKSARPRSGGGDLKPKSAKPKPEPMKAVYQPPQKYEEPKMPPTDHHQQQQQQQRPPSSAARPKSSLLRPPSVRPSSARPGAPRLRPDSAIPMKEIVPLGKINVIVENYDDKDNNNKGDEDEEETVVIQNLADEVPDATFLEKSLDIPTDKGVLVEKILEQIQGPEVLEEQIKSNLEWESRGNKDATMKEINSLRASIQALTKTANPLGKLMSYLHEDVEAMHSELEGWLKMKKHYSDEIVKQKKVNDESNAPLLKQLRDLEENIKKEQEEIATVKYNVLRNDEKIKDLFSKQITFT